MRLFARLENLSLRARLWIVAGFFLATLVFLLGINLFATRSLNTVRALVAGEGLWSKGQRDASYALSRYTVSHDEADYQAFLGYLSVPLADRDARIELEKPDTDLRKVHAAMIRGGIHPSEVRDMAVFLERFRDVEYVDRAVRAWTQGDELIGELREVGTRLHVAVVADRISDGEIVELQREIDRLNRELAVHEDDFSSSLGDGARWLEQVVAWIMVVSVLVFLALGLVVTRAISRSILGGVANLREGTARVAAGELGHRVRATARHELGALALAFDDMTEKLELALRRQREAAEQLADAQALSHVGSWDWDLATDVIAWSDELYRIFGLDSLAFEPSQARVLERVLPEDREVFAVAMDRAREAGEPFALEHRITRPDGASRVLHARGSVTRDAAGRVARLFGTAQDITERKAMEQRLMLSERLASLGTLAGGVAHEINNPLTSVISNVGLAVEELGRDGDPPTPTELQQLAASLGEALDGADRVRRIVGGLNSFSRAEEERRGPVDVRRTLDVALNLAGNELRHRARVVRDFGDVEPAVADEPRLCQVFVNLLVNAAQAIPEGDASRNEIRVATRMAGDRVMVEVHDSGAGIPASIRGRIFDPFFTTKPIGMGVGLGLAISHGILTAFGGDIDVESEVGSGSVFRVTLPVAPVGYASAPLASPVASPASPAVLPAARTRAPGGGRILIIDDEPMVRRTLARALERTHDVVLAAGAREALDLVASGETFDLIFCDLMMPDMTGMDLHEALSRDHPETAAKIVFISGGAFTERTRAFLDQVSNPRLDKPFDVARLRRLVEERLGPAA